MGNNASTFYLRGVEDCTMKSFVREEEEEAVCKSPWCSESLTYTVTLRETHSPALFLQQEHTPRHVTLPNVRFKDYFKKRKVLEDHWFSTFFFLSSVPLKLTHEGSGYFYFFGFLLSYTHHSTVVK